jgi:transcription initiation factor TFIIIB Brf1 subunit/transcription initiation factor TFIIB
LEEQTLSILNRIRKEEILTLAKILWTDREKAEKIGISAVEIITRTSKDRVSFLSGKSSKSLLGGLFYLLGLRYEVTKTQKDLAEKLSTTEITIRASYRKWLDEFPDLFFGINDKFEEDKERGHWVRSKRDKRRSP